MTREPLTYIWGIIAVGIYLFVVGLLIFYFNHTSTDEKKRYVKKDEHRIQVSLSAPKKKVLPKKKSVKKKSKPKPKKHKVKSKKQTRQKKVIKENVVKKIARKKDQNLTKPKKRPKELFRNVKTQKKPLIKVTDKPIVSKPKKQLFEIKERRSSASERISNSLKKQKSMESGVEDDYLARVQEMLEGWPAQSDFAGEKVKVHLKIDPTGHFEFIIKRKANNPKFNQALTEYLKQLQEFGFGPHKGGRTYLFEAEFIAKE